MIYELGQSMEGWKVVEKLLAVGAKTPSEDDGKRTTVEKVPSLIGLPDGQVLTNRNLVVGINVMHQQYNEGLLLFNWGAGWGPLEAEYPSRYTIRIPFLDQPFTKANGRSVRVDQLLQRDDGSVGNQSERSAQLVIEYFSQLPTGSEWIDPRIEALLREQFPQLERHWLYRGQKPLSSDGVWEGRNIFARPMV